MTNPYRTSFVTSSIIYLIAAILALIEFKNNPSTRKASAIFLGIVLIVALPTIVSMKQKNDDPSRDHITTKADKTATLFNFLASAFLVYSLYNRDSKPNQEKVKDPLFIIVMIQLIICSFAFNRAYWN